MKNAAIKLLAAIFLMALAIAPMQAQTNMTNGTGAGSVSTNFVSGQASPYHHHRDDETINHFSIPIAGMLLALAIVAICAFARHRRDKMLHETVRAMIEKGMPVNADVIEQLGSRSSQCRGGYPSNRRYYRSGRLLPGLILTGIGIALNWHSIAGKIVLFIGIAFLIVWLVERNQNNDQQPPKP